MTDHSPTPWFVSGVRFRMNGGEWQSINRYDETKKQDENIACVGYDPRNGIGGPDAHFIVKAVNNHDALVKALKAALLVAKQEWDFPGAHPHRAAIVRDMEAALGDVSTPGEPL